MTEDEAKTKWCPFARVPGLTIGGSGIAMNRHPQNTPQPELEHAEFMTPKCIGSACMAWRWIITPKQAESNASIEAINPGCNPNMETVSRGYCGLAGKP